MNKSGFQLSNIVGRDLGDIFDYYHAKFGLEHAILFVLSFNKTFTSIAQNPDMGIKRNEIKRGLKSIAFKKHIVFYRKIKSKIRIVRILRGSSDLPKHL